MHYSRRMCVYCVYTLNKIFFVNTILYRTYRGNTRKQTQLEFPHFAEEAFESCKTLHVRRESAFKILAFKICVSLTRPTIINVSAYISFINLRMHRFCWGIDCAFCSSLGERVGNGKAMRLGLIFISPSLQFASDAFSRSGINRKRKKEIEIER